MYTVGVVSKSRSYDVLCIYAKPRTMKSTRSVLDGRLRSGREKVQPGTGGPGQVRRQAKQNHQGRPRHTRFVASPISSFLESLTKQAASSAFPVFTTRDSTETPPNLKKASAAHAAQVFIRRATKLKSFPKTGPLRRHSIPAGTVNLPAVVGCSTRERLPSIFLNLGPADAWGTSATCKNVHPGG